MNTFHRKMQSFFAAALIAIAAAAALIPVPAAAATPNYSLATPVYVVPFHLSGQYTATATGVVRFALPFKAKVVGVGASARASGGTSPTLTVDVKAGGTTLLSAPISVTAGAYSEGTITTSAIADEAAVTMDLAITGTSPTWNDITVILTLVRT